MKEEAAGYENSFSRVNNTDSCLPNVRKATSDG